MIERIIHAEVELAVVLRRAYRRDGIEFFTADSSTLQLGYMCRPKDYVVAPHIHQPVARVVHYTEEVLFVRSGMVRVDFYDDCRSYLKCVTLDEGDVVLLARGGHGIVMLEPSEIVEVKQGPYVGDADKIRFLPVVS
jgi:mannose-6-phosphate isomerase-like protein (cupin superfamily)